MALGVVTLAALAATAIMVSQSTWARHSELARDHAQAQLVIHAGLDWARAILSDDRLVSNVDHPGEPWALQLPPIPVDNGRLEGHLEDQQARFNLNNLLTDGRVNVVQLAHFERLLTMLDLPEALAAALADWLDANEEPQPQNGAEDDYYTALNPPYLTANRSLLDTAELALVAGFDANVRERLRRFVTALPQQTPVNANTASAEVLAAVIDGLNLDGARALVMQREQSYFRNYEDFVTALGSLTPAEVATGVSARNEYISVNSSYFIATAQVSYGSAQARGEALLVRGNAGWPRILWRKSR